MLGLNKKPKVYAIFSYRYDANLIPDLKKNLKGIVDEYITHDDRSRKDTWYHEGEVRNKLIEEARKKGANWVLCIDPDERFEKGAAREIKKLVKTKGKVVFGFRFRELWTPDEYRSDGIWDNKVKYILFPLLPDQKFMNKKVHSQWHPQNDDYKLIKTDLNLYHLKNIDPENRTARKELYKSLDPDNKIQSIGYDYLDDEKNLQLTPIKKNRQFYPKYSESYIIKQIK